MQRKRLFAVLLVALLAVGLWFTATKWRRTVAPQPAASLNPAPVNHITPELRANPNKDPSERSAQLPKPILESSPLYGAIRGRVLNDQNKPVAGARVEAMTPHGGLTQSTITNRSGVFTLQRMDVQYSRTYVLFATKEEAGYSHPFSGFYTGSVVNAPPVEVTVREKETVTSGDLHLGPQGGRLIGTLRDANSNRPINVKQNVQMVLRRDDDPNLKSSNGLDTEGHFSFLVPSAPFTVEIIASGYEKKTLSSLRLKPGETRRFDVFLTPVN